MAPPPPLTIEELRKRAAAGLLPMAPLPAQGSTGAVDPTLAAGASLQAALAKREADAAVAAFGARPEFAPGWVPPPVAAPPPETLGPIPLTGAPAPTGLRPALLGAQLAPEPPSAAPAPPLTAPTASAPSVEQATKAWLAAAQAPAPPQALASTASPGSGAAKGAGAWAGGPTVAQALPRSAVERAFSPEMRALFGERMAIGDVRSAAMIEQGEAAERGATSRSVLLRNAADEQEKMAAEAERREAERQAAVQGALDLHHREADALAKEKIDPERFWAEKSTGAKIISAIGLALSAAGPNSVAPAIEHMQRAIDRDISAQKETLASKWAGLSQKRLLLADRMRAFGEERMAETSARADYWRSIETQLSGFAAQTDSEVYKARIGDLQAAVAGERNKMLTELQATAEGVVAKQQAGAVAAQASAQSKLEARNAAIFKANLEALTEQQKKTPGSQIVVGADGLPFLGTPQLDVQGQPTGAFAVVKKLAGDAKSATVPVGTNAAGEPIYKTVEVPNEKAATELQEKATATLDIKDALARMKGAAAMSGPWVGEKKAAYETANTDFVGSYNKAKKFGALDKGTQQIIEKAVPPAPTWGVGWLTSGELSKIDAALGAADKSLANMVAIYSAEPPKAPLPLVAAPK